MPIIYNYQSSPTDPRIPHHQTQKPDFKPINNETNTPIDNINTTHNIEFHRRGEQSNKTLDQIRFG